MSNFLEKATKVGTIQYESRDISFYKTDTDIFTDQKGNREIVQPHVARLAKAMTDSLLFTVIKVNHKGEVLDGQHRVKALLLAQKPIYFVVIGGYGLEETKTYNVNNRDWGQDDYMNSYCDLGKPAYCTYAKFKEDFGFNHGVTQQFMALNFQDGSNGLNTVFKDGLMIVEDLELAEKYARMIQDFKIYEKYATRAFIASMVRFFKHRDYSHQRMLYAINSRVQQLRDAGAGSLQIKLTLERMYNLNYSKKKHLYVVTTDDVRAEG